MGLENNPPIIWNRIEGMEFKKLTGFNFSQLNSKYMFSIDLMPGGRKY